MALTDTHELFCTCPPGLEETLRAELIGSGFANPLSQPGGVAFSGTWRDVMRANLVLRGATRVLLRVASFRAPHLAQLDKRTRRVDWKAVLRADVPVRVEATCRKSRIYHAGAAAQRVSAAIADGTGAAVSKDDGLRLLVRIEDDLCTISLDTTGVPLHQRGHKQAVGKAPLRESLAALFLRQCGFDGTEPVADPMCGSGTLVLEAAEIALGLAPGRSRSFAFERLAGFDDVEWQAMKHDAVPETSDRAWQGVGCDRDDGAIRMASENAVRAGVAAHIHFTRQAVSDFVPPPGRAGLVIVNPPYGARIGNRKLLFALYGSLGKTLLERFAGWRVGVITSDGGLAKATGLPFVATSGPIPHGPLKIQLHRTDVLPE